MNYLTLFAALADKEFRGSYPAVGCGKGKDDKDVLIKLLCIQEKTCWSYNMDLKKYKTL